MSTSEESPKPILLESEVLGSEKIGRPIRTDSSMAIRTWIADDNRACRRQ
jgi:hypothetical protein